MARTTGRLLLIRPNSRKVLPSPPKHLSPKQQLAIRLLPVKQLHLLSILFPSRLLLRMSTTALFNRTTPWTPRQILNLSFNSLTLFFRPTSVPLKRSWRRPKAQQPHGLTHPTRNTKQNAKAFQSERPYLHQMPLIQLVQMVSQPQTSFLHRKTALAPNPTLQQRRDQHLPPKLVPAPQLSESLNLPQAPHLEQIKAHPLVLLFKLCLILLQESTLAWFLANKCSPRRMIFTHISNSAIASTIPPQSPMIRWKTLALWFVPNASRSSSVVVFITTKSADYHDTLTRPCPLTTLATIKLFVNSSGTFTLVLSDSANICLQSIRSFSPPLPFSTIFRGVRTYILTLERSL